MEGGRREGGREGGSGGREGGREGGRKGGRENKECCYSALKTLTSEKIVLQVCF